MRSDYRVTQISAGNKPAIHNHYDICPESPDGQQVIYFSFLGAPPSPGVVTIVNRDGQRERRVGLTTYGSVERGANQQWVDQGHVAYHTQSEAGPVTIVVSLQDGKRLQMPGNLRMFAPAHAKGLYASPAARHLGGCCQLEAVYVTDFDARDTCPVLVREEVVASHPLASQFPTDAPPAFTQVKWSPDGSRLLAVLSNANYAAQHPTARRIHSLFVAKADGTELRYLGEFGRQPMWSPDGSFVHTLDAHPSGQEALVAHPIDGGEARILFAQVPGLHPSLHPDGQRVLTDVTDWPTAGQAAVVLYEPNGIDFAVLAAWATASGGAQPRYHAHPAWSRDGRRVYLNAVEGDVVRLFAVDAGERGF
ncbi:MAG: hypothetical protein GXY76_19160 [Chloroflexi bacterium]|nr:hypothetical protein [Chloroflexota bacterium]